MTRDELMTRLARAEKRVRALEAQKVIDDASTASLSSERNEQKAYHILTAEHERYDDGICVDHTIVGDLERLHAHLAMLDHRWRDAIVIHGTVVEVDEAAVEGLRTAKREKERQVEEERRADRERREYERLKAKFEGAHDAS